MGDFEKLLTYHWDLEGHTRVQGMCMSGKT